MRRREDLTNYRIKYSATSRYPEQRISTIESYFV
jgi:hypothetical protein